MLRAEDAASGRNFLTEEIHQVAERRIAEGGTIEPFRCRHNMLSSQPMCFNLIGPLQSRPSIAAAFVQSVTGRDVEVEDDAVRLEDSPGHLGDATGLDASIRYRTVDGRLGVLGIETKPTERACLMLGRRRRVRPTLPSPTTGGIWAGFLGIARSTMGSRPLSQRRSSV